MQWTTIWIQVTFVGMVIQAVILGKKAIAKRHQQGMEFSIVSFFVCLWAACIYLAMAFGHAIVTVGGQQVYWGRYLIWIVTTPLLLLNLGMIAGARKKMIAAVMGADIFTMVVGAIASLTTPTENYIWYVIGCVAFLFVLWALFSEYSTVARQRDPKISKLFYTLRNILLVIWTGYPIVWILAAKGIGVINGAWSAFLYMVLDLTAKGSFGLVLTNASSTTLAKASNRCQSKLDL